ncbi:hypothetical protein ACFTAO_37175 [Paenibacillus rhizoplanae]
MNSKLSFRPDGTFTIVQFTDLHWMDGRAEDQQTRELMELVLKAERPDLVIFLQGIRSIRVRFVKASFLARTPSRPSAMQWLL